MVATLADMIALMNATVTGVAPNRTFLFFRIYEMPEATVQIYLDMAIRYCNEQISAATQTAQPLVYDDLCLVESCLRLTDNIYSEYMATGFSWSTLADSVNTGNYGQMIQGRIAQYTQQKEHLLSVLKLRFDLSTQDNWGDDPYGVINDNFIQTAPWRG